MAWEIVKGSKAPETGIGPERGAGTVLAGLGVKGLEKLVGGVPDIAHGLTNLGISGANLVGTNLRRLAGEQNPEKFEIPHLPFRQPSELLHEHVTKPIAGALTGNKEILEPEKGSPEESIQGLVQDVATLISPDLLGKGKLLLKGAQALPKALGIAGAGHLAKWGTEKVTGSEGLGQTANVGTQLLVSLLGTPRIGSYAAQQYELGKNVPKGTKVAAHDLEDKATDLITALGRRTFPNKQQFIDEIIDPLSKNIEQGKIDYGDLVQASQDLNSWWPKLNSTARKELKGIQDSIKTVLENAPKGIQSPELRKTVEGASQQVLSAKKLYSAMHNAEDVNSWIQHAAKVGSGLPSYLLGGPVGAAAGIGASYAVPALFSQVKFIAKNPEVQKAYANIFKAYGSKNVGLLNKSLDTLNKFSPEKTSKQKTTGNWEILK